MFFFLSTGIKITSHDHLSHQFLFWSDVLDRHQRGVCNEGLVFHLFGELKNVSWGALRRFCCLTLAWLDVWDLMIWFPSTDLSKTEQMFPNCSKCVTSAIASYFRSLPLSLVSAHLHPLSSLLHLLNSTAWHFQLNGDGEKVCLFVHLHWECLRVRIYYTRNQTSICTWAAANNVLLKLQPEVVIVRWNAAVVSLMRRFWGFFYISRFKGRTVLNL